MNTTATVEDQLEGLAKNKESKIIKIADIYINEDLNVRNKVKGTTEEELKDFEGLKNSIAKLDGLLEQVTVLNVPPQNDPDKDGFNEGKPYVLAWGFRRMFAIQELISEGRWTRDELEVTVNSGISNAKQLSVLQLAENLHRSEVNPVDLSDVLHELCVESGFTQDQIAGQLGISQAKVGQIIGIKRLPAEVREMMRSNIIGLSAGRKIAAKVMKHAPDRAIEAAEKAQVMTSLEFNNWCDSEFGEKKVVGEEKEGEEKTHQKRASLRPVKDITDGLLPFIQHQIKKNEEAPIDKTYTHAEVLKIQEDTLLSALKDQNTKLITASQPFIDEIAAAEEASKNSKKLQTSREKYLRKMVSNIRRAIKAWTPDPEKPDAVPPTLEDHYKNEIRRAMKDEDAKAAGLPVGDGKGFATIVVAAYKEDEIAKKAAAKKKAEKKAEDEAKKAEEEANKAKAEASGDEAKAPEAATEPDKS